MSIDLALFLSGLGAILWVGYRAVTVDLRLKARVRRARAERVADLEHGEWAKIVGRAIRADTSVQAPLSKRECLYVHAWVEERTSRASINGVATQWTDAGQTVDACDFWVKDESGRVLIKLSGEFEPLPLFDPDVYERFDDDNRRSREVTVCDGDSLTVLGTVTRTRSNENGGPFRTSVADAVFLSKTSRAPVILTKLTAPDLASSS